MVAMESLVLTRYTLTNALGRGVQATLTALRERRSGLRPCDFQDVALPAYIGRVDGLEIYPVADTLAEFDCRNHRLAQLALDQDGFRGAVAAARDRYGPKRVAVVLGTSTSGILETERAYRERDPKRGTLPQGFRFQHTHENYALADFVCRSLGLSGPALVISTACSSSAKVFASAARMIAGGACDAAVVGGVDSLCLTTLYGFSSLEVVSPEPCRPADADRSGISIGEAAGFALLERAGAGGGQDGVRLLGYGESSDAYHMSSPHPEGAGAALAMSSALERAGLAPSQIDYINLHGTASKANDSAEDKAVFHLFGDEVPCSSTKGWTGHTLGAAGVTEAVIAALCLEEGLLPGSLNTRRVDPAFRSRILLENLRQPVKRVLSNSFGFGGNNCSLVLGWCEP